MSTASPEERVYEIMADTYDWICANTEEERLAQVNRVTMYQQEADKLAKHAHSTMSPHAEVHWLRRFYSRVLELAMLIGKGTIADFTQKGSEDSFRALDDIERNLPVPHMYWREHWAMTRSDMRSDGNGNMYQGLVSVAPSQEYGQCYAACLNPQVSNGTVARLDAPCSFMSIIDAQIWCEDMFKKISPFES